MSTNQHPSIIAMILGFFGRKRALDTESDTEASLRHAGDRDGTLTMSEEPTSEEILRVASEKNDPQRRDD